MAELTNEEIRRYSRHLIMPEVGMEGQKKLKDAKVLCIGTGGLGSPLGLYLAAAGVGTIGLVDFDVVDVSNLQRQILYTTDEVGQPKLQAAARRLQAMNPHIRILTHETRVSSADALELFQPYDIIVDGTDNFPTRYLVNDACVLLKKPNVYGSIFRFDGQATVFDAQRGPCYRCLYPEPPPPGLVPSCAEGGVLGILPGLVGTIQATEAIKLILGEPGVLIGRLLLVNALTMRFREVTLRKDPRCPVCGLHPTVTQLIDYEQFCGIRPSPISREETAAWEVTPAELAGQLRHAEQVQLIDVREPHEYDICHIEGATLIPLSEFLQRVGELNSAEELVLYCHHGNRSLQALQFLRDTAGFRKVKHLAGGIDAWAEAVDSSMPRY